MKRERGGRFDDDDHGSPEEDEDDSGGPDSYDEEDEGEDEFSDHGDRNDDRKRRRRRRQRGEEAFSKKADGARNDDYDEGGQSSSAGEDSSGGSGEEDEDDSSPEDNEDDDDGSPEDWSKNIFPLCSVTLLSAPSNSGKSFFLQNLLLNRDVFFDPLPRRLVYVSGARQAAAGSARGFSEAVASRESAFGGGDLPALPVVHLGVEDFFDLDNLLGPDDVVILDDLLRVTGEVDYLAKVLAHHVGLRAFLVTQTCLGDKLYSLLSRSHNLVVNFRNTSANRLATHLLHSYFLGADVKAYLKEVFAAAARAKSTCAVKLNSIASHPQHGECLVFEGLERLFRHELPSERRKPGRRGVGGGGRGKKGAGSRDRKRRDNIILPPPQSPEAAQSDSEHEAERTLSVRGTAAGGRHCVLYPELGDVEALREDYEEMSRRNSEAWSADSGAFLLVPAARFRELHLLEQSAKEKNDAAGGDPACADKKRDWEKLVATLNQEIEAYFKYSAWHKAKSLAREILRNKHLCVSSDVRTVLVKKSPSQNVGLLDFLQTALRRSAPGENPQKFKQFRPIVAALLRNKTPQTFIANKALLTFKA